MTTILNGVAGLKSRAGQHLGHGDWVSVTQPRINQFAEATGDHQWIHVDETRAKTGPFGKTIAHGLLTLSMIGVLASEVFRFEGFKMGVNYGFDKIRFPTPVLVGSRLRVGVQIHAVDEIPGGVQTIMELTVEVEGVAKPACVAQMIFRHVL